MTSEDSKNNLHIMKNINPNTSKPTRHYEDAIKDPEYVKSLCGVDKVVGGRMYMLHLNNTSIIRDKYYYYNDPGDVEQSESVYSDGNRKNIVIGPCLAIHNRKKLDSYACFAMISEYSYQGRLGRIGFKDASGYNTYSHGFARCGHHAGKMGVVKIKIWNKVDPCHYLQPVSTRSKLYKSSIGKFKDLYLTEHSRYYNRAWRLFNKQKELQRGNAYRCPCYKLRRKPKQKPQVVAANDN